MIWGVLTLWVLWQWNVFRWSGYRSFPPLGPVCPVCAGVTFLGCVALFPTSFTWIGDFSWCSLTSVAGFSGCFAAVFDNVTGVATSETRARWFGWIGGWLWCFMYFDLVHSRYVGLVRGQKPV